MLKELNKKGGGTLISVKYTETDKVKGQCKQQDRTKVVTEPSLPLYCPKTPKMKDLTASKQFLDWSNRNLKKGSCFSQLIRSSNIHWLCFLQSTKTSKKGLSSTFLGASSSKNYHAKKSFTFYRIIQPREEYNRYHNCKPSYDV